MFVAQQARRLTLTLRLWRPTIHDAMAKGHGTEPWVGESLYRSLVLETERFKTSTFSPQQLQVHQRAAEKRLAKQHAHCLLLAQQEQQRNGKPINTAAIELQARKLDEERILRKAEKARTKERMREALQMRAPDNSQSRSEGASHPGASDKDLVDTDEFEASMTGASTDNIDSSMAGVSPSVIALNEDGGVALPLQSNTGKAKHGYRRALPGPVFSRLKREESITNQAGTPSDMISEPARSLPQEAIVLDGMTSQQLLSQRQARGERAAARTQRRAQQEEDAAAAHAATGEVAVRPLSKKARKRARRRALAAEATTQAAETTVDQITVQQPPAPPVQPTAEEKAAPKQEQAARKQERVAAMIAGRQASGLSKGARKRANAAARAAKTAAQTSASQSVEERAAWESDRLALWNAAPSGPAAEVSQEVHSATRNSTPTGPVGQPSKKEWKHAAFRAAEAASSSSQGLSQPLNAGRKSQTAGLLENDDGRESDGDYILTSALRDNIVNPTPQSSTDLTTAFNQLGLNYNSNYGYGPYYNSNPVGNFFWPAPNQAMSMPVPSAQSYSSWNPTYVPNHQYHTRSKDPTTKQTSSRAVQDVRVRQTSEAPSHGRGRSGRSKSPLIAVVTPQPNPTYLAQAQTLPQLLPAKQPLLIIADLNGTLLYRTNGVNFRNRPGLKSFLQYLYSNHTVMIWTSARPETCNAIIYKILTSAQKNATAAIWARDTLGLSKADYQVHVQVFKRLDKVWKNAEIQKKHPLYAQGGRWSQKNTLLIDDSILKGAGEPYNLINIPELTKYVLYAEESKAKLEAMYANAMAQNSRIPGLGHLRRSSGQNGNEVELAVLEQVAGYITTASSYSDVSTFVRQTPFTVGGSDGTVRKVPGGTSRGWKKNDG